MPAQLAIAASRTIADKVTVTVEWHHFFEKNAQNGFTAAGAVLGNTNEYLAGVEYKINNKWLVSAGYQFTDFNLDVTKYSDLDFVCEAHTIGLGFAYNFNEHIRLNAGVMKPLYKDVTNKVESGYNNNTLGLGGSDTFKYNRWAWGLGVDFHF
jgi:long-chain fatty acid transport protein